MIITSLRASNNTNILLFHSSVGLTCGLNWVVFLRSHWAEIQVLIRAAGLLWGPLPSSSLWLNSSPRGFNILFPWWLVSWGPFLAPILVATHTPYHVPSKGAFEPLT